MMLVITECVLLLFLYSTEINGHGFLRDPPGRSSMWLYGFDTEPNYQHMELFCGGFPVQWVTNGGKCGVCGDRYDIKRENEPPTGKYAKGIITRTYERGSIITVTAELTASHKGYFEFRLCPHNDVKTPVSQDCLDRYLLREPSSFGTKFYVDDNSVGVYNINLKLPDDIVCDQCVMQWRYRTGNSWGCYNNDLKGPCGMGIGPQEEFYACSDVRIVSNGTVTIFTTTTSTSTSTASPTQPPETTTTTTTTIPVITTSPARTTSAINQTTSNPDPEVDIICEGVGPWKSIIAMDNWCEYNCKRKYCPVSHCKCIRLDRLEYDSDRSDDCVSVHNDPYWNTWCQHNCPLGLCYPNLCVCRNLSKNEDEAQ